MPSLSLAQEGESAFPVSATQRSCSSPATDHFLTGTANLLQDSRPRDTPPTPQPCRNALDRPCARVPYEEQGICLAR